LTDRQTDGRADAWADGRTDSFLIASPRWHSMQRGKIVYSTEKNETFLVILLNKYIETVITVAHSVLHMLEEANDIVRCIVSDALVHATPHVQQALHQFVNVLHSRTRD